MKKLYFIIMTVVLTVISCEKDNPQNGTEDEIKNNPLEDIVTGAAADIDFFSAKLYGWCNVNGEAGVSVPFGIEYSHTDLTTNATSLQVKEKDSDNKFCCEAVGLYYNTLYYYRAYALIDGVRKYGEVKSFKTPEYTPTGEAVDLGLSVKWAMCNLGATEPRESGDLFAWGETEPYYSSLDPLTWKEGKEAGYSWKSYKWYDWEKGWGEQHAFTKYYEGDNKSTLETGPDGDDAASKALGGKWRMPTSGEWAELIDNCYFMPAQIYTFGVYLLVSKINGKAIMIHVDKNGMITDNLGLYWSSVIKGLSYDDAWEALCVRVKMDWIDWDYNCSLFLGPEARCNGNYIRPVTE